jgi:hypothetical protein
MMAQPNQSRVIGVEEYNAEGYKMKFQYGIPNKFYPSAITNYDLIMDIDSYIQSSSSLDEWESIIADLNHSAYQRFIAEINDKYLEELK